MSAINSNNQKVPLLAACHYHFGQCAFELMLLALLADWPGEFDQFRHFKTDFVFDNFEQGYVRRAQVAGVGHQRPAHRSTAGGKLSDTA